MKTIYLRNCVVCLFFNGSYFAQNAFKPSVSEQNGSFKKMDVFVVVEKIGGKAVDPSLGPFHPSPDMVTLAQTGFVTQKFIAYSRSLCKLTKIFERKNI